MPKAPPPSSIQKFQGHLPWPLTEGIDDWGLTSEEQESYVEQFRRILQAKNAWKEDEHDYYTLRRFLRARTYDLEKATTMWLNHLAWQQEFHVNSILTDFHFPEKDAFVDAYPQGYHKLDKMGRPVYIQQIGKINVAKLKSICSEDRMLKFHIQEYERCRKVILPICSRLAGTHLDQTFGIMDVAGVGMSHLTGEVKRLMGIVTKYDQDNYPEMLGHICIINAPAVFRMIWAFAKGLIDPRTQSKIEILGVNYKEALLKWVDEENLPIFLGGKSPGSLLDDVGPWSDPELCRKIGVDVEQLRSGKHLVPLPCRTSYTGPSAAAPSGSLRQNGSSSGVHVQPMHSHAGRSDSNASEGYHSPNGSERDTGRFISGVPELVVADTMRRYAASVNSTGSSRDALRGMIEGTSDQLVEASPGAPERAPAKHVTLLDRIAALERLLPADAKRSRNGPTLSSNAEGSGAPRSTRSSVEGTLLHRVEVLEEALDVLLCAQDVAAKQQHQLQEKQRLALEQEQQRMAKAADSGCCVVM